ncbi:serine/threonine-protein kinase [Pseudonocardia sp. GCM10023141]|uniref:serine/threonine-protein kinase n=1 Tax=Pseudonocardia sp. GCM10023141 TaxID=3252653 RepID=UPI003624139E
MPQQSATAAGWVGHVVAGHRIDALIGEGGMGVVFRATHLRLGRTVALKVLPPPLAADQDYRRRFEREAAIAASLEHPNVVPIYDAGHANGVLYLSMRFVQGEDLDAVLRRETRLGIERVCAVLGPIADALDAVHEAGLVHRDVKPGNVLISRTGRPRDDGHVYLCDFGIAKGAAAGGTDLTSAGYFLGTVHYCSPEQIEGRWLDGRSDQYGLACLAYRCLTGRAPYPRDETAAVIYAHLSADPPRPSLLRPDLPPAVDAAVVRAAAKHPDHRFPNCAAFVAALRAALVAPPRPRPRPAPPAAPARRPLPPTLPLPEPPVEAEEPTRRTGPQPEPLPAAAPESAPAPVDVHAERSTDDSSITISWTPGGAQPVEYKVSRLAPDGRWQVLGRTASTIMVDGAVAPGADVPVYGVVARSGSTVSDMVRTAPRAVAPAALDFPAIGDLTLSTTGVLEFAWPAGTTEAMVVVRADRAPETPTDPAATSWKITNMRYQLDGGLLLPGSVARPCHVAVASCKRVGGTLVVATTFGPTAHVAVPAD